MPTSPMVRAARPPTAMRSVLPRTHLLDERGRRDRAAAALRRPYRRVAAAAGTASARCSTPPSVRLTMDRHGDRRDAHLTPAAWARTPVGAGPDRGATGHEDLGPVAPGGVLGRSPCRVGRGREWAAK